MSPKTFNILKWILFPIFFVWCFTQNLVGFTFWIYCKCIKQGERKKSSDGIVYFSLSKSGFGGVSLGYFVFLNSPNEIDCHHEFGHQLQSLLLGPLYLLIIGLPSGITCGWHLYSNDYEYYNFPWESWADKWSGIKHENLKYDRRLS